MAHNKKQFNCWQQMLAFSQISPLLSLKLILVSWIPYQQATHTSFTQAKLFVPMVLAFTDMQMPSRYSVVSIMHHKTPDWLVIKELPFICLNPIQNYVWFLLLFWISTSAFFHLDSVGWAWLSITHATTWLHAFIFNYCHSIYRVIGYIADFPKSLLNKL